MISASAAPKRSRRRQPPPALTVRQRYQVLQNLGLAYELAGRYWFAGIVQLAGEKEDAEQVALLGLIHAARKWQPRRGAFSTCAFCWIRNYLLRHRDQGGLIQIPTQCLSRARKLDQARRVAQVLAAQHVRQWPQSSHADSGRVQDLDLPAAESSVGPEELLDLREALQFLPRREQEILRRRFGLDPPGPPARAVDARAAGRSGPVPRIATPVCARWGRLLGSRRSASASSKPERSSSSGAGSPGS